MTLEHINQELQTLKEKKNYRSLPPLIHEGRDVLLNGQRMLNLSSNDYLGLSNDISLRKEFLKTLTPETFLPTSSSSRLLTGNFSDYQKLEQQLATMFGTESALIFNMVSSLAPIIIGTIWLTDGQLYPLAVRATFSFSLICSR